MSQYKKETGGPTRPHTEWKVVCALLASLFFCEASIRAFESRLSIDLVHQSEIPSIFEELTQSKSARVIFLGNSLTREGVAPEVFRATIDRSKFLEPRRKDVQIAKVHPDDTSIVEWRYLFSELASYGSGEAPPVDLVVLGYAQNQLTDNGLVKPRRLGAYYMDAGNREEVLTTDVTSFTNRCELYLSRMFVSFANAERVRTFVLARLIPMYRDTAQRLNQTTNGPTQHSSSKETRESYGRLQQILELAKKQSIQLAIVAIPVGERYTLDDRLLQQLESRGVMHVDARNLDGIRYPESFPDGYHMDEAASKVFTRFVAENLNERL